VRAHALKGKNRLYIRRLDDDSSNIRRFDDYRAELHNLLKEDVG
jgi:hypothetical protein